jgi:hypothetical protein
MKMVTWMQTREVLKSAFVHNAVNDTAHTTPLCALYNDRLRDFGAATKRYLKLELLRSDCTMVHEGISHGQFMSLTIEQGRLLNNVGHCAEPNVLYKTL